MMERKQKNYLVAKNWENRQILERRYSPSGAVFNSTISPRLIRLWLADAIRTFLSGQGLAMRQTPPTVLWMRKVTVSPFLLIAAETRKPPSARSCSKDAEIPTGSE
jgi:hypothetical protein